MLNNFASWVVTSLLNISLETKLGESIHFFIYDTLKILLLLVVMIFLISYIRSFFPPEKAKQWLSGKRKYAGNVLASLLGVVSPFCSCSTVPIFIGFVEARVPLGVTFSFLISSPIVNEVSIVMLLSLFGVKTAVIYIVTGVIIAIVAGIIIGKLNLENQVEEYVYEVKMGEDVIEKLTWKDRVIFSLENVKDTVKRIWIYLVISIAIGAAIHGYAPEDLLVEYAGSDNLFAVPIATLIGVPLYSNAVGTLPIIDALIDKGVAIGTALAFMMAITALSLPEVILLRKVIKPKLIAYFLGIVTVAIIFTGYLFNIIF